MEKRVVVGGSRTFQDYSFLCAALDRCLSRISREHQIIILSGHCRGTDALAERYARERGLTLEIYPADWSLGRRAGPLRNQQMIDLADYVVAFPGGGPGTKSLIRLAQKKGVPMRIYSVEGRDGSTQEA